jgi:hypothetical protein
MSDPSSEIDPRRVRAGLAVVSLTFLVALVLALVIDDPLGRTVMAGIVVASLVRAALLVRSLRRDARG